MKMIRLIKNILNKRKRRIESLKRLEHKIDLLECKEIKSLILNNLRKVKQ